MNEMSATAPTVAKTVTETEPTQRVKLKDEHLQTPQGQSLCDRAMMFKALEAIQTKTDEELKVLMLSAGYKYADGKFGYACISESAAPMDIVPMKCAAACADKKLTLDDLVEAGAVKFSKKELAKFFSGEDIEAFCERGTAKAASLTVKAHKNAVVLTPVEALTLLIKEAERTKGFKLAYQASTAAKSAKSK